MASELENLRKELENAQRREQEAQRREADERRRRVEEQRLREEEQRLREEEQRLREEEQRLRKEERQSYERRTGKSTLPEFLDACHAHLYLGLTIQPDSTQSTQGNAANAENKPRPDRILPWPNFHDQQAGIWDALMESEFVLERHFTSLHTLEELGEVVRRRQMGSELDLNSFARFTVEDPVAQIVERLYEDTVLRSRFGLRGSIRFENHSNTLSPDRAAEGIQPLSISAGPRRSKRLQTSAGSSQTVSTSSMHPSRPRADQFCVYNISGRDGEMEQRVAALTIEYKAPHKLTLAHINEGLGEMDLNEVVEQSDNESVAVRCRRLVAAVITQGFSYMVKAGLEYGQIYTGEATIFLRIPDDPSTVYYAFSVPKGDVGLSTGWDEGSEHPNRLHLTAVGQAVAFTLRALRTPPRGAQWTKNALGQLKTWAIIVKDAEEAITMDEVPSSEYQPSPNVVGDVIRSPIRFRPRKKIHNLEACPSAASSSSDDEEDPDHGPDTPSRREPSSSSGRSQSRSAGLRPRGSQVSENESVHNDTGRRRSLGAFCTSNCLLGLVTDGQLDRSCPNVRKHGANSHKLNKSTFIRAVRKMLEDQLDYCQEMNVHGARGALFKIQLPRYHYTFVAKGTGVECAEDLRHESTIYQRLQPIQGRYIPVHLGETTVPGPLYYAGAVGIVRMMFLSFAGYQIQSPISKAVITKAIQGLQAIHELGILQKDPAARNILVYPGESRVAWIDFERAEILPSRNILGVLSPNRKRKLWPPQGDGRKIRMDFEAGTRTTQSEINQARAELMKLLHS
ncbi:hypothetical protein B0O99DRAFT_525815 [Bisporella sp. PMI_857]|nr:hypothetical protein B0O99DRAFT_525815 [Bisporella sp. PMI_857]